MRRTVALAAIWVALTGAATPRPLEPPPPDLSRVIPFAAAPSEKPAVAIDLPVPPAPVQMPPFAPATPGAPAAEKPTAFIQSPRALPCVGSWLGIASESLECGRARFQRGDFEDAAKALENAVRKGGTERDLLREARYWQGEALWHLDRIEQADWLFRQVAQETPRQDWGIWALHASGWTALRLREAARARDAFSTLLAGPMPAPLDAWGRHGLALSLYALGRWEEADKEWTQLESRGVPPALARDVLFWHGDTLGRVGQAARAETMLRQFTQGGAHPMFPAGVLRLGWWALAAGHAPEAVTAFRTYSGSAETEWATAGLAQAQMATGDWEGARKNVAALSARRSPLAYPMLFRLARAAGDGPRPVDAEAIYQELLGGQLDPSARAWVLMVKGEAHRAQGERDDARTQFELAQKVAAGTPAALQAAVRQGRVDFEQREYGQSVSDLTPVLNGKPTPDVLLPALLLQGEAAYQAGDFMAAAAAFRRMLVEFPTNPQTPLVRTALAWTYLKQGRKNDARRELLDAVRAAPDDPRAPDTLLLASELALEGGDLTAGREMVDRIIASYPTHPRADFARFNRGMALLRQGDATGAETALRDWLGRAPFAALFGRAHAALGVALLTQGKRDEALREFTLAQKDGSVALGQLGVASVALVTGRRDDAEKLFTAVRDSGTPDEAVAASYGLAAVAFDKGALREFKAPAQAALSATSKDAAGANRAAALLYVLTGIAVDDKDWAGAMGFARRLVNELPAANITPDALERVGAGAAAAGAWPTALESTKLLRERYPQHPLAQAAGLRLAEAQIATGRVADAKPALEQFVAGSPSDADAPRAWLALARAREAAGDRAGALEAYGKAPRDESAPGWTREALMSHARLLNQEKRWSDARPILERLLKKSDGPAAAEAAYALGDTYAGEADPAAAVEYYLSAAYVAPDSALGRRGLLSAARAYTAARQPEQATTLYKKLLAQSDLPADVRDAARKELAALPRPTP